MSGVDRTGVANFLRSRRTSTAPHDVGIERHRTSRTPGLRREEVAELAQISVEHDTRLEQARGARASVQTLEAVADALRLTSDERRHLFHLATAVAPYGTVPPTEVPEGILNVMARMPLTAALVLSATYDVPAWNPLAVVLLADLAHVGTET